MTAAAPHQPAPEDEPRTGRALPRIVVAGVSGSGKSTVGAALAARLGVPFAEGDDFHPATNRQRMAAGIPLTDADRWPWLAALRDWAAAQPDGCVVACSALRRSYRDVLRHAGPDVVTLQVTAPEQVLRARMEQRAGHFMPTSLLDSQLASEEPLDPDEPGQALDGTRDVDAVVAAAMAALGLAV
jgi:gluconokinase